MTIAVRNKKVGTSAAYLKTETSGIDEKIMRGSLCNIARCRADVQAVSWKEASGFCKCVSLHTSASDQGLNVLPGESRGTSKARCGCE